MKGWESVTLGDVLELKRGYDLPTSKRVAGDVPVISSSGPTDFHSEAKVDGPGVIAGRYGTIGEVFFVRTAYWPLNTALYVRDFKGNDPRFCYYFLKTLDWNKFNDKSGVPGVNRNDVHQEPVVIPPLSEQRQIASILGALDDKIDLNRRMAATLEEMGRALYRSWFVDFDPVKAKAEGLVPAYMDEATAALFPDRFGDDGLPEGWQATTIGEVAEIVGGATPSTKNPIYWDNGTHAWATPKDLAGLSDAFLIETSRQITDYGLAKIGSGLSPAGSMLLSSRAPIGYRAIARMPVAVNQGFIVIRETATITGVEAYLWCEMNMDSILSNANGSTFQEISKKNFRPIPYILADEPVRRAFGNLTTPMFAKLATLSEESRTLAALRDTLLTELMSGRLRVGEVRDRLEEAA